MDKNKVERLKEFKFVKKELSSDSIEGSVVAGKNEKVEEIEKNIVDVEKNVLTTYHNEQNLFDASKIPSESVLSKNQIDRIARKILSTSGFFSIPPLESKAFDQITLSGKGVSALALKNLIEMFDMQSMKINTGNSITFFFPEGTLVKQSYFDKLEKDTKEQEQEQEEKEEEEDVDVEDVKKELGKDANVDSED